MAQVPTRFPARCILESHFTHASPPLHRGLFLPCAPITATFIWAVTNNTGRKLCPRKSPSLCMTEKKPCTMAKLVPRGKKGGNRCSVESVLTLQSTDLASMLALQLPTTPLPKSGPTKLTSRLKSILTTKLSSKVSTLKADKKTSLQQEKRRSTYAIV